MKNLKDYIAETLLYSSDIRLLNRDLSKYGFEFISFIDKNTKEYPAANSIYFGFDNLDQLKDININFHNYFITSIYKYGDEKYSKYWPKYNYVVMLSPNKTKNINNFIKHNDYICWHITSKRILDLIYKRKIIRPNDNKFGKLYVFSAKEISSGLDKSSVRFMANDLSRNKEEKMDILLKLKVNKSQDFMIDPDAPGYNALCTLEPISIDNIVNIYELNTTDKVKIIELKDITENYIK